MLNITETNKMTSIATNISTDPTPFLPSIQPVRTRYSYNTMDVTFHQFFNYYFTIAFLLVGIATNCIIVMVMFQAELRRLPLAVYFSALSVSDMAVLVFASVGQFVKQATGRSVYSYTKYCTSTAYLLQAAIVASNWITVCIACERFLVVAFPLKAKRLTSKMKAIIAVSMIITTSIVTNLTNIYMVDFSKPNCRYLPQFQGFYHKHRGMLNMLLLYFIPLGIICLAYITILILIKKRNLVAPNNSLGAFRQKKLTLTSMYICLAFMVFTSPLALYNVMALRNAWAWNSNRESRKFSTVAHSIRLVNYSTNLFIYMATNRQFREITLKLLRIKQSNEAANTISTNQ